jgi:multidrug efflux pump subunit AcrA (membrane-fusion protein)
MKAIFYAVAILATGGAAFFSYNLSGKFEALEQDRVATIEKNKNVSSEADVAEKKIQEERALLAASKDRREFLTQSVSQLKSAGLGLKSDMAKLESTIKEQDAEFAQLTKTLEELNIALQAVGGGVTLENLPEKIDEVNKDREAKQTMFDELEILIAAAEKNLATKRAELDRLNKRMMERSARIANNSMQAVVTAVNQDWGFLVIGAGSNSGFTPQTFLIVQRDGRKIGRVRPSSIEPTQTIAEIDFDSLSPGVRIQPGDRVILAATTTN